MPPVSSDQRSVSRLAWAFTFLRESRSRVGCSSPSRRCASSLSNDFESAPNIDADEQVTQYVIDGTLVYQFVTMSNGRAGLFVDGGGGYLRQLDDGNENVTTGSQFHGGGGLHYWFGSGSHRLGLRVEGRLAGRSGSVDLSPDQKRRVMPTFSAGLAYLF